MPKFFGLSAMPTTLLNAAFSMLPDRSVPVYGPDRLAVVSPMYNEEAGARRALASLLTQSSLPDELAVSVNGSSDATHAVVTATLEEFGFERVASEPAPHLLASAERWRRAGQSMVVTVLDYQRRTAKSEAVNNLVASSMLRAERVLLVDGDTVFDRGFIAAVRRNFYRLRWHGGRPVLEDYALQSGAVTSYLPPDSTPIQRFISAGRAAEYAFSGVLRRGQVRTLGEGRLWGETRLYTVVGCGFAVRRDVLPMPPDTLTEDHDLTLAAQGRTRTVTRCTPAELDRRGFRLLLDEQEVGFEDAFDRHDSIELRRGGNARFVGDALMFTEDPAHAGGYLRQIERWHGGGIQNALKRLLGDVGDGARSPNVRFALFAAQIENLLGLLLLLLMPVLLALGVAGALTPDSVVRNVALWLGIDLAATALMTYAGFFRQALDTRTNVAAAARRAARRTAASWLPYMVLKVANPISFVAAASRVIPAFFGERRALRRGLISRTQGVVWERPTAREVDPRTVGAALTMVSSLAAVFVAILALVPASGADRVATQRMLAGTARVDMADHAALPLLPSSTFQGVANPSVMQASVVLPLGGLQNDALLRSDRARVRTTVVLKAPRSTAIVKASHEVPATVASVAAAAAPSAYCRPAFMRHPAQTPMPLPGSAQAYRPLDPYQLLMLARLAPIEPYVETAATAYQVPVGFLLQMLINESYLDPLAVGKTGDKGLSQMTSDGLTLLRATSEDPHSALYNPHLLRGAFNVFDPDFSICAGAAKLAWAMSKPVAKNQALAYALYINPTRGVTRDGAVSDFLREPVDAMSRLAPLVATLGSVYAAYRVDPAAVALPERRLVQISDQVAAGRWDLATAYRASQSIGSSLGLGDADVYGKVLRRLYPGAEGGATQDVRASAQSMP